jgi:membrane protease YdiL (CAAX protease family)
MPLFAQNDPPEALVIAATLAVWACAFIWVLVVVRWRRGQPLAPYEPRRPVPWKVFDVVLALCLYFVMPMCVVQVACDWLSIDIALPSLIDEGVQLDTAHPLARVLLEDRSVWAILVCLVAAVVVAPVTEEMLFRLILQGWLEVVERRLRRRMPRRLTAGFLSVVLSSGLFAALHFRVPSPRFDVETILFLIQARSVASLLTVGVVLCWLRFAAGATLADFGIVPQKFGSDLKLGLLAFVMITVPVYGLLIAVNSLLPENAIADPLPIFLLAVALGGLYCRTHRIVPSMVLHMAFNAAGVILAIWTSP